jgi:hypothetical protein
MSDHRVLLTSEQAKKLPGNNLQESDKIIFPLTRDGHDGILITGIHTQADIKVNAFSKYHESLNHNTPKK